MKASGSIARFVRAWIGLAIRRPLVTLALAAVFTFGAFDYAGKHLGINTDTADMISPDVPWRARFNDLKAEMPRRDDTLILVVDGPSIELAERAALAAARGLARALPELEQAWVPTQDPFLRRHALVLMDEARFDAVAERLVAAQPLLGRLAGEATLVGLLDLLAAMPGQGSALPEGALDSLLDELARVLASGSRASAGEPGAGSHPVSWQGLLTGDALPGAGNRQFVLVRAPLDYSELLPAGPLMAVARDVASTVENAMPGVQVRITGRKPMAHEEMDTVASGMPVSAVLALLLVTVVLLAGLRCWRTALAVTVCLVMGLVWTAAFAGFAVGDLNLISIAFAVLYIGLGVDYAVHYCLRFGELRGEDRRGDGTAGALVRAGGDVGASLVLCAITTGVGFLAFVPTDFSGVSDLGIVSGAGMFISLAATLSVLPPLLMVFRARPTPRGLTPGTGLPRPRLVLAAGVALAVAAALVAPRVAFDHNPINLRDPATESVATYLDLLDGAEGRPWTLSVLAPPDELAGLRDALLAVPEVRDVRWLGDFLPQDVDSRLARLDDLALALGAGFGAVDRQSPSTPDEVADALERALGALGDPAVTDPAVMTRFAEAVGDAVTQLRSAGGGEAFATTLHRQVFEHLPGLLERLDTLLLADAWTEATLTDAIRDRWRSEDGRWRLAAEPAEDLSGNAALERFVNAVQAVAPAATGVPEVNLRAAEVVAGAFIQAFASATLLIAVLLFVLLRRALDVVLVLGPLILAGVLTCAVMVVADLSFNFANVIALPLLLGIGVDNGVHLVHRLRHAPPASGNLLSTSTSRAIVLSALTTLSSFGNLAWSPHPGTASMGWVLSIGLAMTLLTTLVLLPALLQVMPRDGRQADTSKEHSS